MKRIGLMVVPAMMMCFAASSLAAGNDKSTNTELLKQAKVTKAQATKTALSKVPNGTVKESELEKEHGKLVWSFDIATPDTTDITEVQVDATTGKVLTVEKESAKAESKEQKKEATEKHN
jgi:uncharacterized membrane protein YkoI